MVALMPCVLLIVWLYQRLSAPAVAKARQLRSDINAQVAESIGGMSVLQANNAQERFAERFSRTNEDQYTQRVAEIRANAWLLRPALDMLNVVLLAAVIWFFGQRGGSGTMNAARLRTERKCSLLLLLLASSLKAGPSDTGSPHAMSTSAE